MFCGGVDSAHRPTGRTQHYFGDVEQEAPSELQIAKDSDVPGYYLLYLDGEGEWITDSYKDSFVATMEQADWEFAVKPDEWETNGEPAA